MDRPEREKTSLDDLLWKNAETIRIALEQATSLDDARVSFLDILHGIEDDAQCDDLGGDRLEWSVRVQAIQTLKRSVTGP